MQKELYEKNGTHGVKQSKNLEVNDFLTAYVRSS